MKPFTLLFALIAFVAPTLDAADQPNFLFILGDDCTYNHLPLYGGQNAKTPPLAALAPDAKGGHVVMGRFRNLGQRQRRPL